MAELVRQQTNMFLLPLVRAHHPDVRASIQRILQRAVHTDDGR